MPSRAEAQAERAAGMYPDGSCAGVPGSLASVIYATPWRPNRHRGQASSAFPKSSPVGVATLD